MPIVNFVNEKKQLQVPEGANLRKEALKAGVEIYPPLHRLPLTHCPGIGQCGTCRVLITKGMENASPMGFLEKLRLKYAFAYIGHEDTMRLSCQVRVDGDMDVVTRPPLNWFGENFFS
jgi:ferredoxin